MIAAVVVGLLALAALVYVIAPLRREQTNADEVDPWSSAEDRKIAALSAILDLESERDVGKVSDEDFAELTKIYETEAVAALSELAGAGARTGVDRLEQEIAEVRSRLAHRCPVCGNTQRPDGRCPRCDA